jgi:hypothetical protein
VTSRAVLAATGVVLALASACDDSNHLPSTTGTHLVFTQSLPQDGNATLNGLAALTPEDSPGRDVLRLDEDIGVVHHRVLVVVDNATDTIVEVAHAWGPLGQPPTISTYCSSDSCEGAEFDRLGMMATFHDVVLRGFLPYQLSTVDGRLTW